MTAFRSGKSQIDDITLLELTCKPVRVSASETDPGNHTALVPWQLSVRLTPQQLRNGSPVPQLIDMLGNSPQLERHKDYLHTILAELFANALEHGVLGLNSELKRSEEGYLDYYQQRERRLRSLDDGYVNIAMALTSDQTRTCIKIRVDDSGQGFDFSQHRPANDDEAFGRGISLLQTLCTRVEYSNGGTRVNVEYLLD